MYEWVTFLEAKTGVWEMKWFLRHKIKTSLSVKVVKMD